MAERRKGQGLEHLLEELMETRLKEYRTLLTLTQQEKAAVMKNDVETLSAIIERQQSVLAVIKKLEAEKDSLFCRMHAFYNMPEGEPSFRELIQHVPEDVRKRLRCLADDLAETGRELHAVSMLNKTLIDTQLKYTSFWINTLTGQGGAPGTYSDAGRVNDGPAGKHCLVDQAI
jgi:flagellar biosynthesis/type III secretory pathway chaperone